MARRWRYWTSLDGWYGVATDGHIPLNRLTGINSPYLADGTQYQPTPAKLLKHVLSSLRIDHRRFVFIDFGSGKGRTLLLASHSPFKRVVGIEFAPELHAQAVKNLKLYRSRHRRCWQVESVCADAATFEVPLEPSVFYFFNPFGPQVLRRVLTNIQQSLSAAPREVLYIYCNPVHPEVFEEMGVPREALHLVPVTDADLIRG
jgi:SAM-dependent methyltransferase